MGNTPLKIAAYTRISDEDRIEQELDENTSLINQRKIITAYCDKHFPNSPVDFYEDRAISGYTFAKRPDYQAMRAKLFKHEYDILILKDLSRFSRRNSHGLAELEDLRDEGIRIISIGDNLDIIGTENWLDVQLRFLLNEQPVTDASRKVKQTVRAKQEAGEWLCTPSFGYTIKGKLIKGSKLEFEIVPEAAKTVQLIFKLYLDGWGYKRIQNYLDDNNIPTPRMVEKLLMEREGRTSKRQNCRYRWNTATIQGILQNDAYIGTYRGHKHQRKGINGADTVVAPDEQIVIEHHHPPIIDDRTWAMTCEQQRLRTRSNYRGVKKYDTPYTGILFCGDCGSKMFSISRPDLEAAYICSEYQKRGLKACTNHRVTVADLDDAARSYLTVVRDNCTEMESELQKAIADAPTAASKQEETLDTLYQQLQKKEKALATSVQYKMQAIASDPDDTISISAYDNAISNIKEEIKGIQASINMLNDKRNNIIRAARATKTVLDAIDDIINKPSLSRLDIQTIFDKIVVHDPHPSPIKRVALRNGKEFPKNQPWVEFFLRADVDALLRTGKWDDTPSKEMPVNFKYGSSDIAKQNRYVQCETPGLYKVITVNVISSGSP